MTSGCRLPAAQIIRLLLASAAVVALAGTARAHAQSPPSQTTKALNAQPPKGQAPKVPSTNAQPSNAQGLKAQPSKSTAPNAEPPDDAAGPPTALEEALIERVCNATSAGLAPTSDAFLACLKAALDALRADFGRDLARLSKADRNALDADCSRRRAVDGADAYVRCIDEALTAIRIRRGGPAASPSSDAAGAATSAGGSDLASSPAGDAAVTLPSTSSVSRSWGWMGVLALAAFGVAGGALVMMKSRRRVAYTCRVCGKEVPAAGELCPECRHQAADALRQAASERTQNEHAGADVPPPPGHLDNDERRAGARDEPDAERRVAEGAQREDARREEARREDVRREDVRREDARRLEEEASHQRQRSEDADRDRRRAEALEELASEEVFDPRAILDVPADAAREAIDAAYAAAKAKYAPEQVAHLGPELQAHYKRKAEAVDRAYGVLTA
jgi:hypothetical protein